MVDNSVDLYCVRTVVADDFAENGSGAEVLDFEMIGDLI